MSLNSSLPNKKKALYLPNSGRAMGLRIVATKGTGKSRLAGRFIAWHDFRSGVPTIIIDPVAGLCNDFLDKLRFVPKEERLKLLSRIRYINMAGVKGKDDIWRVVPIPLYAIEGDETLFSVAERFVDLIRRIDPNLAGASVMGMNAIAECARYAGVLLVAMGYQLTELKSLLENPLSYRQKIVEATKRFPEVAQAAIWMLETYPKLSQAEREKRTQSIFSKLTVFDLDPVMRAMYGANIPFSWEEVEKKRQTVIFDFSGVNQPEQKKLLLLTVYWSLMRYIKRRGVGKHHTPISLIIDEITFLLGNADASQELLAEDLVELIDRISRSHNVWPTIIHQETNQLSQKVEQTFMRMGNQIIGSTSDPKAARAIAERFSPYEPHRVKNTDAVYASAMGRHYEIDERKTFFSVSEQVELNSQRIMKLPTFNFLLGVSPRDGQLPTHLTRFSMERLDRDIFPDKVFVDRVKTFLTKREGISVEDIRKETLARRASSPSPNTGNSRRERVS